LYFKADIVNSQNIIKNNGNEVLMANETPYLNQQKEHAYQSSWLVKEGKQDGDGGTGLDAIRISGQC